MDAVYTAVVSATGRDGRAVSSDDKLDVRLAFPPAMGGFALGAVLRVKLPEHLRNETGRKLVEQAHAGCPYSKATRGNIPVELVVE
jgi:osmotically inducible protein OsmC